MACATCNGAASPGAASPVWREVAGPRKKNKKWAAIKIISSVFHSDAHSPQCSPSKRPPPRPGPPPTTTTPPPPTPPTPAKAGAIFRECFL